MHVLPVLEKNDTFSSCNRRSSGRIRCGKVMRLPALRILAAVLAALLGIASRGAAAGENKVLFNKCFPKENPASVLVQECKGEDCGLQDEVSDRTIPIVQKKFDYVFLGATDIGEIWGSKEHEKIDNERIRALLYLVPVVSTKVTYYDQGGAVMPYKVIKQAFFSAYDPYTIQAAYTPGRKAVQKRETSGGIPALQMIDLHCSAKKIKMYDNSTLYYKPSERAVKDSQCVDMIWEKPADPPQWQPMSSMTMDILIGHYCPKKE